MKRFPTIDHVWIVAAIALIALRPLMTPIPPHDFWWHMATGREIIQTGSIPTVDHFSYTRNGEPFYNQGWLAQVILYGIHQAGGVELIIVVQSLVVALAYGLILLLCIRRSGAPRLSAGILLLLIMPLSFDNWNVRPQSYALPLFGAYLYILTMWRTSTQAQTRSWLWLLPPLMVIWVNLHGTFVLGCVMIAFTFVAEWVWRFLRDHALVPPSPGALPREAVNKTAESAETRRVLVVPLRPSASTAVEKTAETRHTTWRTVPPCAHCCSGEPSPLLCCRSIRVALP